VPAASDGRPGPRRLGLIGSLVIAVVALSSLSPAVPRSDEWSPLASTAGAALYPIRVAGRWGFIDRSGRVVVPPKYESILSAAFEKEAGKAKFDELFMANRVGPETTAIVAVRSGAKWGFVDHDGRLLPLRFDEVGPFRDGMAAVRQGALWGFANTRGSIAVPLTFDAVTGFMGGVAIVSRSSAYGVIDPEGRFVIKPRFEMIRPADSVFFDNRALVIASGKKGFVSRAGTVAVPAQFDDASPFSEGLAAVTRYGRTGYIDTSGHVVIRPRVWNVERFSQGRAVVSLDGLYGYIDRTGAYVVEPRFNQADRFTPDGEAVAWKGATRGIVDLEGHWSVPRFEERQRMNDSVSVAVMSDRVGLVRRATGEMVLEYRWKELGLFAEGLAEFRGSDGRLGFIDVEGRVVIAPRFTRVASFVRDLCKAATRDTLGYIDRSGAWVWATRFR
jgi:hypothetical protein